MAIKMQILAVVRQLPVWKMNKISLDSSGHFNILTSKRMHYFLCN